MLSHVRSTIEESCLRGEVFAGLAPFLGVIEKPVVCASLAPFLESRTTALRLHRLDERGRTLLTPTLVQKSIDTLQHLSPLHLVSKLEGPSRSKAVSVLFHGFHAYP